jgi:hypothetical protein
MTVEPSGVSGAVDKKVEEKPALGWGKNPSFSNVSCEICISAYALAIIQEYIQNLEYYTRPCKVGPAFHELQPGLFLLFYLY